mmetsp:Transcript_2753/g.6556  ORF Transcript_2753/g.6556 Transcript_2753/m.6556 type:complete len:112 (+) Transcript_2753:250-585(+)
MFRLETNTCRIKRVSVLARRLAVDNPQCRVARKNKRNISTSRHPGRMPMERPRIQGAVHKISDPGATRGPDRAPRGPCRYVSFRKSKVPYHAILLSETGSRDNPFFQPRES